MSWRFFHRFFLFRWLSLNVSKRGASVSVGPPGAKLTVGTHGGRVTVGVPGTGVYATEQFNVSDLLGLVPRLDRTRSTWREAFVNHLFKCIHDRNITVLQMKAALAYRDTLRLTDAELGSELLEIIAKVQAKISEAEAAGRTLFFDPDKW